MVIISDIHGSYKTFKALLKKCPKQQVVVAGDIIDRGPSSKDLIKYIRNENISVILGNHESMAINAMKDPMGWLINGGFCTLASYGIANFPAPTEDLGPEFLDDIKWLKSLPYYLNFEDIKDINNRHLVISHASCVNQYPFENMDKLAIEELLWNRNENPDVIEGVFNVFGHTPKKEAVIAEHFAMIDTGCSYNEYGDLSALIFPEKEVITQKYID